MNEKEKASVLHNIKIIQDGCSIGIKLDDLLLKGVQGYELNSDKDHAMLTIKLLVRCANIEHNNG